MSHHLLTDKSSAIIQPWKHHCLQGAILTYKFSVLLLDITVLLAPLQQQNWPTSSSTFHFFLQGNPCQEGSPRSMQAQELLAELSGSRSQTQGLCDTCRTHRLLADHVPGHQCPCTRPQALLPHRLFSSNLPHSIAHIPDQVFGERRIGKGVTGSAMA